VRAVIVVLLLTVAAFAENWPGIANESIGKVGVGTKADDAIKILGKPTKQTKAWEEGGPGSNDWSATWTFPNDAVVVVVGKNAKGPFTVKSIDITGKNALKTVEGIGIGSKLADVKTAYGKYLRQDNDAWRVYGGDRGLSFFVDKDAVTRILYAESDML